MQEYLAETKFIDFSNKNLQSYFTETIAGKNSGTAKIVGLYYAIRDDIRYDPYHIIMQPEAISASLTFERKYGYCIEKSILLCAAGRWAGIPSRLGFSIVRNHLASEKFLAMLRSDLFVFHGYNEFFIDGKWVKCTPAFNKELCAKHGTTPLDFDGKNDSIFQPFSPDGKEYMEYIHEYGTFADFPYFMFESELRKYYSHLFESGDTKYKDKQ